MLGLRFTRPEMTSGRPLRNTAVVRYAPALRARAEALRRSPAPTTVYSCFSWRLLSPLTNTSGVCKTAFRPQTANRPEGHALPLRRLHYVKGNSCLCHTRYRKQKVSWQHRDFLAKNLKYALDKCTKEGYIIKQGANVAQLVEQFTRNE